MTCNDEQRRRRAEELRGAREQRSFAARFELRQDISGQSVTMTGYASVTNHDYEVAGYIERIEPGAFRRTLKQDPAVVLLANHTGLPLASTRGGSLDLEEDERGLRFLPRMDSSDPDVSRVTRKVKRGDLTGASFAFRTTSDEWNSDYTRRVIKQVELSHGDISVVNFRRQPRRDGCGALCRRAGAAGGECPGQRALVFY